MNSWKVASINRDIKYYFGFLFERGFKICSTEYSPKYNGNWVVRLESSDCIMYITSDRGNLLLEFSALQDRNTKRRINIENIIFLISEGQTIIRPFQGNTFWGKNKQFERLADLLKKHIDQISSYINENNG